MRPELVILAALALTVCSPDPAAPTTAQDASSTAGPDSWPTGGTDEPPTPTTGPGPTSGPASTGEATTGPAGSTGPDPTTGGMDDDEALLRQAIAGEVDPGEALNTIARRGGLPVATAGGDYLFACLCGPGAWQLAGDHDNWAGAPMNAAGPLWWLEAEVPAPDGSLYKFHDPETPAPDDWIADPLGRRYGYDDNGRYSLVAATAVHLERWYGFSGAGLQPRDVQVLVPDQGIFSHALYVHDGQNLFDPGSINGGWKLQDSAPPGLLIVGIDNTGTLRLDEYTHVPDIYDGINEGGGLAADYAMLVDGVIRPQMEDAYGPAEVVGTMGSSLGGLVSLVIADLYPDRYAMALSLSGTMGWGSIGLHNQTIIERYAAAGHRDIAIYIDSGGFGPCGDLDMDGVDDDTDDADNYCENAQLRDVLTNVGYSEGADLWYVYAPNGQHSEFDWAARVDVPMAAFMTLSATP